MTGDETFEPRLPAGDDQPDPDDQPEDVWVGPSREQWRTENDRKRFWLIMFLCALAIAVIAVFAYQGHASSISIDDATAPDVPGATSIAPTPTTPPATIPTTEPPPESATTPPPSSTPSSTASPPTTAAAPAAVVAPTDVTVVVTLPSTAEPSTVPAPSTWTVSSIIDGDTLDLAGPGGSWTVRLIGINTPERGECFADEATAALAKMTTGGLVLVADVSDTDQYGRKLRYVETTEGVDIGGELVRSGFAIARRYEPDTARATAYEGLQADAEAAGVGMWAPDACGPATNLHLDL